MATAFHFTEITDPDTGRPIVVARNLRDDPIGALYATRQIDHAQHQAFIAYQNDIEASSLRAPSRGPSDISGWRSRRPDSRHRKHLARAGAALSPDQVALIQRAATGHNVDIRKLNVALDVLAEVYGLSTKTRH